MTSKLLPILLVSVAPHQATPQPDVPVELGRVSWSRDHAAAFAEAKETDRPVLLLFQEIPGCITCQRFGRGPLSHPLMVEAIEQRFVPLAIYNNRDGEDARVLKSYREPAWNNPIVRFFEPDGEELLERRAGVWSEHAVAGRMIAALEAAERDVPAYLRIVHAESRPGSLERAVFAMHCFWKGEAVFGAIDGVRATRAGWLDGREVVEVSYDPRILTVGALTERAAKLSCADRVYVPERAQLDAARRIVGQRARLSDETPRDAKRSDQRYHLGRSTLRFVPLTPLQATRVNAALERRADTGALLSPRQRALHTRIGRAGEAELEALAALAAPKSLGAWEGYLERVDAILRDG